VDTAELIIGLAIVVLVVGSVVWRVVLTVRASIPRWKQRLREYRRLFKKPHIKTTTIMLALTAALAAIVGLAVSSDYIWPCVLVGLIAFWVRKIWVTDDYDRAAKAAAEAERVREEARRQREAQRVPEPSISYLYSIFGLSQNATDVEIRTAYRRLVKKYHPDRTKYSSAANVEMFRKVQEAYAELRAMRGSWAN
jgi:hypothetical protein